MKEIILRAGDDFSVNGRPSGTLKVFDEHDNPLGPMWTGDWTSTRHKSAVVKELVDYIRSIDPDNASVLRAQSLIWNACATAEKLVAEIRTTEKNAQRPAPPTHDKPVIKVKDRLAIQGPQVWSAIAAHNRPDPRLFRWGSKSMVDLIPSGDRTRRETRMLFKNELLVLMAVIADWVDYQAGNEVLSDPPRKIIDWLMGQTAVELPQLNALVSSPYCMPDGSIVIENGYNEKSGFFMDGGIDGMENVPEHPTDEQVQAARELLTHDLFVDFPFVTDADRAHAVAVALTCLARPMFDGPTPLFVFNAPSEGTGKGLLPEVIGLLVTGRTPHLTTAPIREEEWRKEIPALLESAGSMVLIDNVDKRLDSPSLASVLTSANPSFRVMRTTTHQTLPNRLVWTVAGNNVDFSREIGRRVVFIQMDARMEDPSSRTGFKHEQPKWTVDNRDRLLHACFVLIRNWISKGKPLSDVVFGSYDSWAKKMGGILDAAGIPGLLENRSSGRSRGDDSTNEWGFFVEAWWEDFGEQPMTAAKLVSLASKHELMVEMRSGFDNNKAVTTMGKAVARMRDRIFGQFAIRKAEYNGSRKHNEWRLEPVEENS